MTNLLLQPTGSTQYEVIADGQIVGRIALFHALRNRSKHDFAFRIDRWTDDGERIVEHVAGAEDFQIAMATYHAARKRWPKAAMTLRQDMWVIETAGVRELAPFFSFRGPRKAEKAAGDSDARCAAKTGLAS